MFSKLEIITSFTNKMARWLKVILSIGMPIILIPGTMNPLSNMSVIAKGSRSEVTLNQQNKIKGKQVNTCSACFDPLIFLNFNQVHKINFYSELKLRILIIMLENIKICCFSSIW